MRKFYTFLFFMLFVAFLSKAQTGTHLNFDGVNDGVSATSANLPLGNTARTIEAWIKTTQNTGGGTILTYGNLSTNNRFALYQTGGKLNFVAEFNDYSTNVAINDGIWHHVAATHDGTTLKIYLDGVQVGTSQARTFNTTGTQISIGHKSNASEYFNGDIDEIRIWNTALTANDILSRKNCELQGNETGLVAYYKFNQGTASGTNTGITSLTDATSNTSNGTLTNFALTGATSNWLSGSPVTAIPTAPTVTPSVSYCQNATVSALTATGTSLKWYTAATGGTTSTTAPAPSTTTVGTTSYWVTSSNANGCESTRAKMDVVINALPSAPTVTPSVFYCQNATASALTATGTSLQWYTAATGGTSNSTAPTPSTTTVGTTPCWVSQTNASGCESARSKMDVTINGQNDMAALTMTNQTISLTQSNGMTYYSSNCSDLIVSLMPNGTSPVSGTVESQVWFETTQPATYVKRHYQITPATNPNSSSGHITLYFTQAEFDDYNNVNTVKLPTDQNDAFAISNLRVEKKSGSSNNGSGLPNTYTGTPSKINPNDAEIVWNTTMSRWEVSFNVTSFSGFFVLAESVVLPVELLNFNGYTEGVVNQLQWETKSETDNEGFNIERSSDGNAFENIGFVKGRGNSPIQQNYRFTDRQPLNNLNYYRLKQMDVDGKFSYSNTISLNANGVKKSDLTAYPNPSNGIFRLKGRELSNENAILINTLGQVFSVNILQNEFNIQNLPAGIYYLQLSSDKATVKIIKE